MFGHVSPHVDTGLVAHTCLDTCMSSRGHDLRHLCLYTLLNVDDHTHTCVATASCQRSPTPGWTQVCAGPLTLRPAPRLARRPLPPRPPCLLRAEGEYFSDEQMRFRAPLLYEQYIGQYLTLEELSARTPAQRPPKPGPPGTPACPLSDLLLQSYQERELQQRLLQQQEEEEEEEACLEEEEEEEDSDEEGEARRWGGPGVAQPGPRLVCLSSTALGRARLREQITALPYLA